MDIFKKTEIVWSINSRLIRKYGLSVEKVFVSLSPDQNGIQVYYRYNGEIKSKILKHFKFDLINDLQAYCGLDPITEIIIIMTDQVALKLPKDLFSNMKWIVNRNIKWKPVSDYSSSEDKERIRNEKI